MKLTTPTTIPRATFGISHQSSVLLFGSCFAQNIGERLLDNKFEAFVNPNGIIYNPISVVNAIKRVVQNEPYTENELQQFNEKWFSFNHHGSFSSFDKSTCLTNINRSLEIAHQGFENCNTLFITFGSAWIYEYQEVRIVANCHKIPNKEFKRRLLSVKEILSAFKEIIIALKEVNIIFTVSPVRHIKDGLYENNLSKSTLHLAINNLVEQNNNCHYFPAYELIVDELRDYRFFRNDLVHPSKVAVNYVWDKFNECYFDEKTQELIIEIEKIKSAINHKPFNYKSNVHQQFIGNQIKIMNTLAGKYTFLDFKNEIKRIQQK